LLLDPWKKAKKREEGDSYFPVRRRLQIGFIGMASCFRVSLDPLSDASLGRMGESKHPTERQKMTMANIDLFVRPELPLLLHTFLVHFSPLSLDVNCFFLPLHDTKMSIFSFFSHGILLTNKQARR